MKNWLLKQKAKLILILKLKRHSLLVRGVDIGPFHIDFDFHWGLFGFAVFADKRKVGFFFMGFGVEINFNASKFLSYFKRSITTTTTERG